MRLVALAAVLGVLVACTQAPDPDSLNKPRIEQIQPASFMSAQTEFKVVDDGATVMKDLFKEVALDRDRKAKTLGVSHEIDQWTAPDSDGQIITDFYLTGPSQDSLRRYIGDRIPQDRELAFQQITPDLWRTFVVMPDAALDADAIETVTVSGDPNTLTIDLTDEGAREFAEVTSRMAGHKLAVLVDGTVQAAPVIQSAITGGHVQLTLAAR